MGQSQTADNDLQKAIDDITNITNTDPVFSDPVAAPSTVPEGDTGELSEPVGPFPEEPKVEMVPPAPEPIAPLESVNIPELNVPPLESVPAPEAPQEEGLQASQLPPAPTPEPLPEMPTSDSTPIEAEDANQIKNSALRDLVPLLDHLDMDASKKFKIYYAVFESSRDLDTLKLAYKTAREITDESERAKALYNLIESIDNQ